MLAKIKSAHIGEVFLAIENDNPEGSFAHEVKPRRDFSFLETDRHSSNVDKTGNRSLWSDVHCRRKLERLRR